MPRCMRDWADSYPSIASDCIWSTAAAQILSTKEQAAATAFSPFKPRHLFVRRA